MIVITPAVQRQQASDRSKMVRSRRALLKRDVAAGRRSGADAVLNPPEWAEGMRVFDLLTAIPKIGRIKASNAVNKVGISPSKRLGDLTDRQRRALIGALPAWSHDQREEQ